MHVNEASRPGPRRDRGLILVLALLVAVLTSGLAHPVVAQTGENALGDGGFEHPPMTPGEAWRPIPGDFDVTFDTRSPYEGQSSLRLDRRASASSPFAAVAQAIDATPYRGRTIRFRAAARAVLVPGSGGSGGALWLRVDRQGGARGFFDNMHDRPIRSHDWSVYEVTGPVAADASRITVGFLLSGAGSAWIDAASLEIVPDAPAGDLSTERPSGEALRNLEAFAKLYGYVRWFSATSDPSDPRWAVIAVEGVRDVEAAQGDDDLARRLRHWFEPMAPGLIVGSSALDRTPLAAGYDALFRWRHTGVAFGSPAYRSERAAAAGPEVWRASLVDGLAVAMPVTAVVPEGPAVPAGPAPLLQQSASPENRAIRLGGVVIAWNVFRHFYPYFGDDGLEWDQSLSRWLEDAAMASDGPGFVAVLERMVARLDDGHGDIGPRAEAYSLPLVWQPVEGVLAITGLPAGGYAGLSVGDVVLGIDGMPAEERLAGEAERVSASTAHRRTWRATERLRLRETDRVVELEIQGADGGRSSVSVRPVPRAAMVGVLAEPRPAPVTWLPAGAWYFDLTRLDNRALTEALALVRAGHPVIFDIRGYPGGINAAFLGELSSAEVTTPPFRIPVDLLPEARSRTWESVGWSVPPGSSRIIGPVAFLTDARAISYAETLLAMVAGHDLGEIVGSPTAGTNGNINPFTLPGGYRISWTGMEVVNHDGTPLHGHGVTPTVPAQRTIAGVRAGRDEVLERALDVVARRPRDSGEHPDRVRSR